MTEVILTFLLIAFVGGVTLAVVLWPEVRRLRERRRENAELQREHDRLVQENRERAQEIFERWSGGGLGDGRAKP